MPGGSKGVPSAKRRCQGLRKVPETKRVMGLGREAGEKRRQGLVPGTGFEKCLASGRSLKEVPQQEVPIGGQGATGKGKRGVGRGQRVAAVVVGAGGGGCHALPGLHTAGEENIRDFFFYCFLFISCCGK